MDFNVLNLKTPVPAEKEQTLPKEVTSVLCSYEIDDYKELFSLFDQSKTGYIDLKKIPRILLEIDADIDKAVLAEILGKYMENMIKEVDLNDFLIIVAKVQKEMVNVEVVMNAFKMLNPINKIMPVPNLKQILQNSGNPLDDKEMTTLIAKAVAQQHDKYFNYESLVNKLSAQVEEYERILRQRERAAKEMKKSTKQVKFVSKLRTLRKTTDLHNNLPSHETTEVEEEDKEDHDEETKEIDADHVEKEAAVKKKKLHFADVLGPEKETSYIKDGGDNDDDDDDDDDYGVDFSTQKKQETGVEQKLEEQELEEQQKEEDQEEEEEDEELEEEEVDYEDSDKYKTEDDEDDDETEYEIPISLMN